MKGRGAAYLPRGALLTDRDLRLKLRFSLCWPVGLRTGGVLSTPGSSFLQAPLQVLPGSGALANGLEQQRRGGSGDVQRLDPPGLWECDQAIAGSSDPGSDP